MADKRRVRATLENGKGDVLLEGESLSKEQIIAAMTERFPDADVRRQQFEMLLIRFSDGTEIRSFRHAGDAPRMVGGTVYL